MRTQIIYSPGTENVVLGLAALSIPEAVRNVQSRALPRSIVGWGGGGFWHVSKMLICFIYRLKFEKYGASGWLAQVECVTLDLKAVSSSPVLDVEIT